MRIRPRLALPTRAAAALLFVLVSAGACRIRESSPEPVGDWAKVGSGADLGISWTIWKTEPDDGGTCLSLELRPPPTPLYNSSPEKHLGRAAACAPDPATTNDSIAFFDWNERVHDPDGDGDSRVQAADFYFVLGRTADAVRDLRFTTDGGGEPSTWSSDETFLLIYSSDSTLSTIRWSARNERFDCLVRWQSGIPQVSC
jgi:hypothetical protein